MTRRDLLRIALPLPAGAWLSRFNALAAGHHNKLKITDIKAMQLSFGANNTLIKVETDGGVTGYGEAGSSGPMARARIETMKPLLVGHDPLARLRTLAVGVVHQRQAGNRAVGLELGESRAVRIDEPPPSAPGGGLDVILDVREQQVVRSRHAHALLSLPSVMDSPWRGEGWGEGATVRRAEVSRFFLREMADAIVSWRAIANSSETQRREPAHWCHTIEPRAILPATAATTKTEKSPHRVLDAPRPDHPRPRYGRRPATGRSARRPIR